MPRVHTVEKARKDQPQYGIKKGDKYYWWKFRYGGKRVSKTYPRQSQLTQSAYLATIYDLNDEIGSCNASTPEELEEFKSDIVSRLEELRDEQEEKRNNMPEQLQDSNSGEILQERYDTLDNAISELESIDTDFDEPEKSDEEWREEAIGEVGEQEDEQTDDDYQNAIEAKITELKDAWQERLNDWLDEKKEEISGVDLSS